MARGTTYERNGRWYVRFDAGPDPATGERRQRSGGGHDTKREAEAALAKLLVDVHQGAHVDPSRQTVAEYCRYWLEVVIPGAIRDTSLRIYRTDVDHIISRLGAHRLVAVRAGHISRAFRVWEEEGLGGSTRELLYTRLSQIFRQAVRERVLAANPMDGVTAPKAEPAERFAWSPEQLALALARLAPSKDYPLWRLLALSGLRRGEGLGLRWRDVNWDRGCIRVEQQVTQIGGSVRLTAPKTPRSRRTVELDTETMRTLTAHRQTQLARRLAHPAWQDLDLVYPRRDGSPYRSTTICWRWRQLIQSWPDLPYLTLHGLRHTHASILMAEDGNVRMIADRLGHDPMVLLRIYAHAGESAQRRGVSRLVTALGGAQQRADGAP
ncbi:MAG: putative prophage phiRv2 integrase [Chloroflexi bacterium]|nr:putative prophage phiRv2 integrase [Chloroflexota bacterium]